MRMTEEEFEGLKRRRGAAVSVERAIKQAETPTKARRPRRQNESWHQSRLVEWARATAARQSDAFKRDALRFFHAVPNGAHLKPVEQAKMKREGRTKGILDLRLDYVVRRPDGNVYWPGLLIEMKEFGRQATEEQVEYAAFMLKQGFACEVCYSWSQGARSIVRYMGLEEYEPIDE